MNELAILLALTSALGPQGQSAADSAELILARAAEAYQAATTLRSEFVQKIEIPALETAKEGRGVVFQRKPNYFVMRFEEPKGDIVVADGQWFWMYYPSAQPDQVIRTAIDQTAEGATLGGQFLVSPTERYVATYVQRDVVNHRAAFLLSLVPRFEVPYTLVRVWIDAEDYLVRKFEIREENETVRTITLSNVEAGIDLPQDLFRFSPPPGVEVFTR
ncbi:MAG: outer membrane lipoprotein carrier protein LolA [Gemmatimonadota bacterium]|nr:MAG: outer membrane lipoprotein carrier protein LolA [Gemmatimonadota bacterium]